MMMTPVPFLELKDALCRSSMHGMRKARVFPDPVLAAPMRSFPDRRGGMAIDWICVRRVNPSFDRAVWVGSERGRAVNLSSPSVE